MEPSQERMSVIAYQIFTPEVQRFWEQWNLRVAVLFSLFFQIILIFLAPERKRSGRLIMQGMIWISYLLADWVAAFAVGLISSSQGQKCEKAAVNDALAAFWAPFLLLHLGGPDTITAFSLEDNELWIRHMFSAIVQGVAVGYVFSQSLPNQFWLPTALMFSAGTFKYFERTRALYLACLGNLKDSLRPKPDPGPNYAQLMEEYASNQAAAVPEEIFIMQELGQKGTGAPTSTQEKTSIEEKEVIQRAFNFYRIFRGLIVDHMFSFHERNESRKFFFSISAKDAFKVLEVELCFMYDALYTKMETVHIGLLEYISRSVCSALLVVAFVLFSHLHRSNDIHRFDMGVTYALLGGAVFLDFVALIRLIFSDWTVALIEPGLSFLGFQSTLKHNLTSFVLAIYRIIPRRKRWSNNMYQFNLISYCLKQKRNKLLDKTAENFALKEHLDRLLYTTHKKLDDMFRDFIFEKLEEKAKRAEETKVAKSIYSSRGEWALLDYDRFCPQLVEKSVSEDVEYDESVLMWHIATDICFHYEESKRGENQNTRENRDRCKQLSDYLLYLLIMQPNLMLSVSGIANIRFQDTCEEATKFFERSRSKLNEVKLACDKLIKVDTTIKPVEVKGDRSKSLLFDAVRLAKELQEMVDKNPEKTWEMMSKVWLELLCYGASHCRGDAHAQKLRTGGELITFVWLLMAHFGLGEQFRIEAGHARAKLIVNK